MAKTEAKTNPDTKGNPTLKNYLENVNTEIRRTHNTLMEVIENLKARNVPYTADVVKEELVMKLKPDSIRPTTMFFATWLDIWLLYQSVRGRKHARSDMETLGDRPFCRCMDGLSLT